MLESPFDAQHFEMPEATRVLGEVFLYGTPRVLTASRLKQVEHAEVSCVLSGRVRCTCRLGRGLRFLSRVREQIAGPR